MCSKLRQVFVCKKLKKNHLILRHSQKEFGLKLPQWTEKYFPNRMQHLNDKGHVLIAFNSELKRLKGGIFIKKAFEDWKKKINNEIKQKIFVFSAHDVTVVQILSTMNVWEQQFPDYGITAILELSQHKETKEFGVEVSRDYHKIANFQIQNFHRFSYATQRQLNHIS